MTTQGHKLPATRRGETHKVPCGDSTAYVTINRDADGRPREMFVKADNGWQGWADALALTASIAMRYGAPLSAILAKWRGLRFDPEGGPGQGSSLPDAIARRLAERIGDE